MFLRGAISFPRRSTLSKTPCPTKCVPFQLRSLLRHRKIVRYINNLNNISHLETFQALLLILCSVGANIRDVTAKQMVGSLPVPDQL